jgi:hypothetical protein
MKLAVVAYGGPILTSTNAGGSWITNNAPSDYWSSVASSANGMNLVAAMTPGPIFSTRPIIALDIETAGDGLLVSWPWTSAGFLLETNSDLTTTNWAILLASSTLNEWRNEVQLPIGSQPSFFRLRLP